MIVKVVRTVARAAMTEKRQFMTPRSMVRESLEAGSHRNSDPDASEQGRGHQHPYRLHPPSDDDIAQPFAILPLRRRLSHIPFRKNLPHLSALIRG